MFLKYLKVRNKENFFVILHVLGPKWIKNVNRLLFGIYLVNRRSCKVEIVCDRTNYGKFDFRFENQKIWNSIRNEIKSNQIKSNQMKSNQIKSDQIKSDQIRTLSLKSFISSINSLRNRVWKTGNKSLEIQKISGKSEKG